MLRAFLETPIHVRLKVLLGSGAGKEFKIPMPMCLIGREEGCDLRINNDAISRRHCVIALTAKQEVTVRDLESRNGTFINDERITGEFVAANGDVLRVATKEFEIQIQHR